MSVTLEIFLKKAYEGYKIRDSEFQLLQGVYNKCHKSYISYVHGSGH